LVAVGAGSVEVGDRVAVAVGALVGVDNGVGVEVRSAMLTGVGVRVGSRTTVSSGGGKERKRDA
jgi:hypothetical protein